MNDDASKAANARRRRTLVLAGLGGALAAAASCGGGGSGGGGSTPSPPPSGWSATGRLVYSNGSEIGVYDFASRRESTFARGTTVFGNPGIAVSRGGIITALEAAAGDSWNVVLYSLTGARGNVYNIARDVAIPGSAAMISPDATKMAFSLNEPRSASDSTRIDRVLVIDLTSAGVLGRIDGFNEPVWAGTGGQLMARSETTNQLHLFDTALADAGRVGTLVLDDGRAVYDVSRDGRYVVYTSSRVLRMFDRNTGTDWQAAQNNGVEMLSPTFSPDGGGLALLDQYVVNYEPHVAQWTRGAAVTVDDSRVLANQVLADCVGRIGWTT